MDVLQILAINNRLQLKILIIFS